MIPVELVLVVVWISEAKAISNGISPAHRLPGTPPREQPSNRATGHEDVRLFGRSQGLLPGSNPATKAPDTSARLVGWLQATPREQPNNRTVLMGLVLVVDGILPRQRRRHGIAYGSRSVTLGKTFFCWSERVVIRWGNLGKWQV